MRSRWLKTQQDWPGCPGWTEVGAEGLSLLWGNTTLQRFSFTFGLFFNWQSPNFSALGIQIEDTVKANPMELPKCRGAGGSDLRDSADATWHRNPTGGQNTALCYLALKITWKRKSLKGFIPLWCAEKSLDGVCLENKDFPPLPWAIFGISYSSPVYLSWKITNILEDVALTDEGITFLHWKIKNKQKLGGWTAEEKKKKQIEKMPYLCVRVQLSGYFHGPHHDNISVSPKDGKTDLNLYVLLQRITASKRGKTVVVLMVLLQTTHYME